MVGHYSLDVMPAGTFEDNKGNRSSKRIFGALGMVYFFALAGVDGLNWYEVNDMIIIAGMGICATLLGLDTVTDIWKK